MIKTLKNSIPNLFTLANLCCGVLGIILVFEGELSNAAYLIWIAALCDFLDGFLAKILKAQSELGKQLDSLADLVTFGVLPSIIYYSLLKNQFSSSIEYLAFSVAIFSALRLAKFNIDQSQSTVFSGLTTTANGILASSVPLILAGNTLLSNTLADRNWLLIIMLVSAVLMVTPLKLLSLKFSDYNLKNNVDKIILIGLSIIFIAFFRESAIPMIIGVYILLSLSFLNGKKFKD